MGRRGVRSRDGPALRQLERDAVDREADPQQRHFALPLEVRASCHKADRTGTTVAPSLAGIGATNSDGKFRAFEAATGALLWETTLPAAGNATPSIYMLDERQYVVIACGGGKNGAPSGSSIVAFRLPG